jgi:hypothetical protein
MGSLELQELSTWWSSQDTITRNVVLREARFNSSDIKEYELTKKSIKIIESEGWGVEAILKARLRLGYYN